jgi:predicted nucleic acid-binding protein
MSEQGADPTRVVADADVLAADLLVGGPARAALDHLRRHSWMTLVASDHLLDDAAAVVADLADEGLAGDWRKHVEDWREHVDHPPADHSGLASAYRGEAAHLLSFDDQLTGAAANTAVQPHVTVSIRPPDAFARLFYPASLYESVHDDQYPGPDRDPRA